jgi:hypothetical protein
MTVLLAEQQLSFIRRVADRFCCSIAGVTWRRATLTNWMMSLSLTGCRWKQDAEIEITSGFGIFRAVSQPGISPGTARKHALSVARYS